MLKCSADQTDFGYTKLYYQTFKENVFLSILYKCIVLDPFLLHWISKKTKRLQHFQFCFYIFYLFLKWSEALPLE
jgi:hypothetical protein